MRITQFILMALLPCTALSAEPPKGWRLPTEKELIAEPLRSKSPTNSAAVVGDFNGDGQTDYAYLFVSTVFDGEGLLVWLSTPTGYSWKVIDTTNRGESSHSVELEMGIDLAEPGEYKTACAKGYWECGKDEPEMLVLAAPGIWHFHFESAASIWSWDQKSHGFKRTWISD